MAPATVFPSTIRDYVHKKYLLIKTINNRNLLIIPDETKIQEVYKRGDTTSDNNAFCAFKKQLCEYGFSVVARKDWLSLGLDLNSTWVYEHHTFTPKNCEKCILKKPSKPITVRFQINTETGEIEWVNSGKTVMHGEKLINCIKETMLGDVLMSSKSGKEEENRTFLRRKRRFGKKSSDENHSYEDFSGVTKRSKESELGAKNSIGSLVSDEFRLTCSVDNPGGVASDIEKNGSENNGIPRTKFQSNSDLALPNKNFQNFDSSTFTVSQNVSDYQIESPNSYLQVDSPNSSRIQCTSDSSQNSALQNIALQNKILRNSILLNLSRQSSPLQNLNLHSSAVPCSAVTCSSHRCLYDVSGKPFCIYHEKNSTN